jgi:hypothetical protein
MFVEQDTAVGPAKPVEVRENRPRKTAASMFPFVALILAFL